jgi:hypothetical protein
MFFRKSEPEKNYNVEVWRGSSGNVGPVNGSYEQAMTKAHSERAKPGVTKVVVKLNGREIARL